MNYRNSKRRSHFLTVVSQLPAVKQGKDILKVKFWGKKWLFVTIDTPQEDIDSFFKYLLYSVALSSNIHYTYNSWINKESFIKDTYFSFKIDR